MEIKLIMESGQSLTACVSSRELSNLKEAIRTNGKFRLNSVTVDTLEIEACFIANIEFIMED